MGFDTFLHLYHSASSVNPLTSFYNSIITFLYSLIVCLKLYSGHFYPAKMKQAVIKTKYKNTISERVTASIISFTNSVHSVVIHVSDS